jgi:hypothetical protein
MQVLGRGAHGFESDRVKIERPRNVDELRMYVDVDDTARDLAWVSSERARV